MNDPLANEHRDSWERKLLGVGIFVTLASLGFFFLFGMVPRARPFALGTVISLAGVVVGVILVVTMVSRLRRKSTILPAFISLLCATLLTGGAGYGYVATCNYGGSPSPWSGPFLALAFGGAAIFAIAALWLIVAIIVRPIRGKPDGENQ